MQTFYYTVAHFTYKIVFADGVNTTDLIHSSEVFKVSEESVKDKPLLFTLTVDDTFRPTKKGEEIGQFDCAGNNHGVYLLEDGSYQILVSDCAERQACFLQAKGDFSEGIVALNGNYNMRTFGLNNALMMMFAFAASDKDTVLMHASVIRKDGKGYLCLGVSGTGKSTHTGNWLKYIPGTDLMNDDNPVVRIVDGVATVFGSPWSGKTPCYRNVEAPIGGFLQLKQAPHNMIRRQTVVESFASLLPSCSVMKWDHRDYIGTCDTVQKIIETTPTYYMENLPNEEAVQMSYNAMANGVL